MQIDPWDVDLSEVAGRSALGREYLAIIKDIDLRGQVVPIQVYRSTTHRWVCVDGYARVIACRTLKILVHAIEVPSPMPTEAQIDWKQKFESFQRMHDVEVKRLREHIEKVGEPGIGGNPCSERVEDTRSPREKGKVLCLEPGCRTWISGKPSKDERILGIKEREHFCKKHAKFVDIDGYKKFKTYDTYPTHDRDGDPIWVGARFQVTKMHDLDMGHLLNCINLLEKNAEKREHYTGKPKAESLAEMPKHALLVAELKQRDACKLCKGGLIVAGVSIDGSAKPEDLARGFRFDYCACKLGQERKIADRIAEQSQGKSKAAILVLALAFVTALLNAPAASQHVMEFLGMVHERLRHMGVLR